MTTTTAFYRLKDALIKWRADERRHAILVLRAAHPLEITTAADAMEYSLHQVRLIVDSEPWSDILQGL